MEWKSNWRRTQSLSALPPCDDDPTRSEAGLRDKITSVSQLVARYQTSGKVSATTKETLVNNNKSQSKATPSILASPETHLEPPMWRNDDRERAPAKTILARSKSMGSLQASVRSIGALKALFESKADVQNQAKRSFSSPSSNKAADVMMRGEVEEVKPKTEVIPPAANDAKYGRVTQKVGTQSRAERRKTIGGIDLEKIAASEVDEKRRSVADFRDSSLIQTHEKLSVKAMSALYLSKVEPRESTNTPAHNQSSESGKRVKPSKMTEDSQKSTGYLPPPSPTHQSGPEDISGAYFQQSMPSQLSKEKLYQQRQKCELRRLLKHTHPELKMLDDAVDEELAEVLSSETGVTTGETGYEGEVLSRRLLFENCSSSDKVPHTPKRHVVEETVKRRSAVFEEHKETLFQESVKGIVEDNKMLGSSPDPNTEGEEEMVRVDVQAARLLFESQIGNESAQNPGTKLQEKKAFSGDKTGAVQKQRNLDSKNKSHAGTKSLDLTPKQGPCVLVIGQSKRNEEFSGETVFEESGKSEDIINTSETLFKNNPFISTNIEREHSFMHEAKSYSPAGDSGEAQDYLIANVKNRAHLFESMPFDKIRHQNKDEVETMVENIKETLKCLCRVNAIHSGGSIIEVIETMIAKKAKFTVSEGEPRIKYDEVAEGGAQNFLLQLIPRATLKPHITYLKEDRKGSMEATVVKVPMHQHQFTTNQDTEFKTANVVQVVEDILNQDNSLRKGVIIQEDVDTCAEVIVYSLYNYFDEEDVKHYYPPQGAENDEPEPERGDVSKTESQERRTGAVESTISCLLGTSKDHTCQGSVRPEITAKGNVKLFKSCIEKGDLQYLKILRAEQTEQEQELRPNQNVAEVMEHHYEQKSDQSEDDTSEWVPVDVKKLKNMFSGDHRPIQPKQNAWENVATSKGISCAPTGQSVPLGQTQTSAECNNEVFSDVEQKNTLTECGAQTQNSTVAPQGSHLGTQDDERVHKAELVEVIDDNDEISNLQIAIHNLQQATVEAKSLHQTSQEKEKLLASEQKTDHQHESADTCRKDTHSDEVQTTKTFGEMDQKGPEVTHSSEREAAQQENEDVVFQGKLQAALNSLGRSNINVTRGDFRAAMIYRSSSKPHKERSHNVGAEPVQKPAKEAFCPLTELESTRAPMKQKVSKEPLTAANADSPVQSETLNKEASSAVLGKGKPIGPKPAIPPKPGHLKVKEKNPEVTLTNTVRLEETVQQPLSTTSLSLNVEQKQDMIKLYEEALPKSLENEVKHQVKGSVDTLESDNTDKRIIARQQEMSVTAGEKICNLLVSECMNERDGHHVNIHEECKKFGGKKAFSMKNAPVKPKRVKISQSDNKNLKHMTGENNSSVPPQTLTGPSCSDPNTCGQTADSKDENEIKHESKVEMREKRGRSETEDERRQRLSVHMDEIMKGNITAAMEIFDNLRKQEELQSILSRVEEIEQDTSEVDVRALRGVFENVPDWVVSSVKKKQKKVQVENKEERMPLMRENTESKSSMAHVFGDLERASEEIMNLKEQTLARLMDIEGAIKKALFSVSTFKSDSDIAGLSCLFKESLGTVHGSPSSGSISKISIGSSRTKSPTAQENKALPLSQEASIDVASAKQRASPPSSPAFISIQSAARQTDKAEVLPSEAKVCPTCQHSPRTEEKFRTTKTLTCNSPALNRKRDPRKGGQKQPYNQPNPKRELSVLEVQTDREGNSIMGTKTVTENYETTDNFGNRFYSSKTSTVVTTQPEMTKTSTQAVVSPATLQMINYPELQLPTNQKP